MAIGTGLQDGESDDLGWVVSREYEDYLDWMENQEREAEAAERARVRAAARAGVFSSIWEFCTRFRRPARSGD